MAKFHWTVFKLDGVVRVLPNDIAHKIVQDWFLTLFERGYQDVYPLMATFKTEKLARKFAEKLKIDVDTDSNMW